MPDRLTDADLDAIERDRLDKPRLGRSIARERDLDLLAIRRLLAEVRRLRAMEQRVRELHEWYCAGCEGTDPECGPMCGHCYDPWPCATIAALDGGE